MIVCIWHWYGGLKSKDKCKKKKNLGEKLWGVKKTLTTENLHVAGNNETVTPFILQFSLNSISKGFRAKARIKLPILSS